MEKRKYLFTVGGNVKLVQPIWKTLWRFLKKLRIALTDFPGGTMVKNLPANAGDMGSSPGPGRFHMPRSN